jgi:hypothetical protein
MIAKKEKEQKENKSLSSVHSRILKPLTAGV